MLTGPRRWLREREKIKSENYWRTVSLVRGVYAYRDTIHALFIFKWSDPWVGLPRDLRRYIMAAVWRTTLQCTSCGYEFNMTEPESLSWYRRSSMKPHQILCSIDCLHANAREHIDYDHVRDDDKDGKFPFIEIWK